MNTIQLLPAQENIDLIINKIRDIYPPEKHLTPDDIIGGVVAVDNKGQFVGMQLVISNPFGETELGKIWITPEMRRQGIGAMLVGAVAPTLPLDAIVVTRRNNPPINKILPQYGFSPTIYCAWDKADNSTFIKWMFASQLREEEKLQIDFSQYE